MNETESESGSESERHKANTARERGGLAVRPGFFLTLVILSCLAAGGVIFWLLRSMRI